MRETYGPILHNQREKPGVLPYSQSVTLEHVTKVCNASGIRERL